MTDLAKLVVRLEAEIGKYSENLAKADKQLKKFSDDTDSRLLKLAGGIAAFFTVDRLVKWGDRILENADHIGKLAERTGIGTESLSKLQYAFEQNEVSGEAFTTILRKLNQNLAEAAGNANSEAAQAFRALGIETKTATGETIKADEALLQIADRFAGYEDGANKSAIATKLLGKTGEEAIPALNGGSAALKQFGDEAQRAGRVISEDLAKQAEEFNDRLARLKGTLIDGIGNRIAADLLPSLNALGKEFEEGANQSLVFERSAEAIATAIRALVTIALGASTSFLKLGNAIGGSGAALAAAAQGEFSRAGAIIDAVTADNLALEADYQKARAALWKEGGEDVLQEIEITVKKIKAEAPNLAGGKELEDATKKAIDKLKDMARTLDEQVATFGLGEAAALKYRLEIGNLAPEVQAAGAAGAQLRDAILGQAEALEKLKNAKEVADALSEVNAQILQLQGNSAESAIAELDKKNAALVTQLRRDGNAAGLAQLDTLTKLVAAQEDFNTLTKQADQIESDLARTEERLRNSRDSGALTDLQMQRALSDARKNAIVELQGINAEQEKIAQQTGNPEQVENVKRMGAQIENLAAQSELAGAAIRKGFEGSFADALKTTVKNIHDADDAFRAFIDSVLDQLLTLAVQNTTQSLFSGLFGGGGVGGGGSGAGFFSTLAGIFGGGAATGRDVGEGMAYRVNERTPNSEWFVPNVAGKVVPAEKLGGSITVSNTFVLPPGGRVSLETQQQIATRTQNALANAQRRNA